MSIESGPVAAAAPEPEDRASEQILGAVLGVFEAAAVSWGTSSAGIASWTTSVR
jgi:hypothetical protein